MHLLLVTDSHLFWTSSLRTGRCLGGRKYTKNSEEQNRVLGYYAGPAQLVKKLLKGRRCGVCLFHEVSERKGI